MNNVFHYVNLKPLNLGNIMFNVKINGCMAIAVNYIVGFIFNRYN